MPDIVIVDEANQDLICRKAGLYVFTGARVWLEDDVLHHIDGPALVSPDGAERWYIGGREATREVKSFFYEKGWSVTSGLDTDDKRALFISRFLS
jgi:hypothetical protein